MADRYRDMSRLILPAMPPVTVPVAGTDARLPIHRIYCVGRNYAAHVTEMGGEVGRDPPVFFCKPADAVSADGAEFPYPRQCNDLQPEVELVVALGQGGADLPVAQALDCVYGYAVGSDWTCRDRQARAKRAGEPWDLAKGFDCSAGLGLIYPASQVGHPRRGAIGLRVDGEQRQQGDLQDLLWGVADIIAILSTLVTLRPGDLIYTGTPQGVGPVQIGQTVVASIDGLGSLTQRVVKHP
jgi:fumarylpyruvate hydrolase